jgi:long-subunit fatty acid transport protein
VRALPILILLVAGRALAYPLMAPRPVPDAIAGPTDPHVAATFYNPAAMGYLRGVHFFADGGLRWGLGNIKLDSGGSASPSVAATDSFAGITWDLATETLSIGLSAYTPFTEFSSYPTTSPLRYHEQSQTFATFEQALAGAWQIERHIAIGAGFLVNESWYDYRYARDLAPAGGSAVVSQPNALCGGAPCGYENPLAQQGIGLRGFDYGFGFIVGLVARPDDRVWIGISYTNHKAGGDLSLRDSARARVTPAPGQGPICGDGGDCFGADRVLLLLPDMVQAGIRVTLGPRTDIEAQWRFLHYGARSALDATLQGGTITNANVPPQYLIDRGLQNTYLVELSTRHTVSPALRLSPSLTFETAAVASDAVNPAAIEAPKLDAALTLEWTAWRSATTAVMLGAHVGGTAYFVSHVSSRFDAVAETACVDANLALDLCQKRNYGDALPSAAGDYTYFVINAGLALGVVYQP